MSNQQKIAIILRGVPGSGKSSFVDMILRAYPMTAVHAIDDLHKDDLDNFVWNEPKARAFYLLNFANFVKSCEAEVPLIICDCINLVVSDFQQYLEAAKEFGYQAYVVVPDMPDAEVAAVKNTHGVTKHQINEMFNSWENWPNCLGGGM
jgi:predicted kinase